MINNKGIFLSVICPVYQSEATIIELVARLIKNLVVISSNFEIILVDDCSPDNSWDFIKEMTAADTRVHGMRLSRNFGQHRAITAGLDCCRGEYIVIMDCDLQDRPEEIPALFAELNKGYDLVMARRINRQDIWSKKLFSRLFYKILSYLTNTKQDSSVANFGIYNRKVINAVLSMRESIRYFPVMVRWVGFRIGYLSVMHAERPIGNSSYVLNQRLHLGLEVILAYSDKPLILTVKLGLILSGGTFLFIPITLIRYWRGSISQPGYTSLILSIWFFSGLLLSVLGMIGLYIGKTFEQVKNRPLYITDEITNIAGTSNKQG
ncbi:glycosyltransferase family 2 protein [Hymenobacter sp. BT683]|uniref:Glycosyltransferase family 2 protein n=1 Tax=Hymenobacter jeongseonensis TaxID=2791027 RepID=A0ABS0IEG9_9BACT|nr:glycosyltransferase family 2 protein [Hymenobacter jeongseonensis]MBF9236751.1 glycosyltransferase family 2 protein [Hymenobacter jeongseonensis]